MESSRNQNNRYQPIDDQDISVMKTLVDTLESSGLVLKTQEYMQLTPIEKQIQYAREKEIYQNIYYLGVIPMGNETKKLEETSPEELHQFLSKEYNFSKSYLQYSLGMDIENWNPENEGNYETKQDKVMESSVTESEEDLNDNEDAWSDIVGPACARATKRR